MKTLIGILTIGLFTFTGFVETGFTQDSNTIELDNQELRDFQLTGVSRTKTTTKVKGSPFLDEDFTRGYVILDKNKNLKTNVIPLRFDTYSNQVQFLNDNKVFAMDPAKIDEFVLHATDGDLVFKKGYKSDNFETTDFLRVISEGEVTLLAHHTTTLMEGVQGYGSATKLDEYISGVNFYLGEKGNKFERIKLKEKDFRKNLTGDIYDSLKSYAENNNLSFDNEKDLKKILSHVNENSQSS